MRNVKGTALAFFVTAALMIVGPAHSQPSDLDERLNDQTAYWTNQSGSTMTLAFDCNGSQVAVCTVSGSYVNNVTGYRCKGTSYPITGVYYSKTGTISWSVAWSNSYQDCASVTGWTGYLDPFSPGPLKLVTNWNLAYSTGRGVLAIMQGKDTFTHHDAVTSGSLLQGSENK